MCDVIEMPDGTIIDSIREDGTCMCQNSQKEIFTWIVNHIRDLEIDEKLTITTDCVMGYAVMIEKVNTE